MGQVARNALKGYTFQHYIFTLFVAKMDVERKIKKIESEMIISGNFDDLYIEANENYRIQVKNYPSTTLDDIVITRGSVRIKGNSNDYNQDENNIVVINTDQIDTDSEFMGFPARKVNGIVIIPLTPNDVQELLDDMFSTESREIQIIQFAFSLITSSNFVINEEELPKVIRMSLDLSEKTVLIRKPLDNVEMGILWIYGKPGVGKSHYVEELIQKHNDAIAYRFWTGPQDERLMKRLQFDAFLDDVALEIFNSPRSYTIEELIQEIIRQEKILIIDGLDHVENYNPKELQLYIDFINSLEDARLVVLSRPLLAKVSWKPMELINWSFDETALYLAMAYNICAYRVVKEIYEVTDGYPIITYFIAEHYIMHKEINIAIEIENLNQYYGVLLEKANPKSLLSIFATNNSFFTESELRTILEESFVVDAIMSFIEVHPYLFKRKLNRVSLIHDSFNTYLRYQLESYPELEDRVNQFVQSSLLSGEVNFMSRLSSFELSKDFYNELLWMYSEVDNFSALLERTLDYNSITSFYNQLQKLLEQREGVLDIYHYYAFSLAYQMANRNDLIGYDGLVYQILVYMNEHVTIEEEIFSTGVLWNTFILLKLKDEASYKRYLADRMYDPNQINELYETFNDEQCYFEKRENKPNYKETLERLQDNDISDFHKQDILIRHMVKVWINQDQEDIYYKILDGYLNNDESIVIYQLSKIVEMQGIESRWSTRILSSVKYQLNELGELGEKNFFYGKSLDDIVREGAPNGSFETVEYAQSFIRLANHKKRQVDIYSVNRVWTMYYNRKDYSVYTLDSALRVFEKFGFLKELKSIDILRKVMNQSEKGIRHLLGSYIAMKDDSLIQKLDQIGAFNDRDFPVDIFDLIPEKINCLDVKYIDQRIYEMLSYHSYGKTIEYRDILNPLRSKYCSRVLDAIDYYGYKIFGMIDDNEIEEMIIEKGIDILKQVNEERDYIPFEHGCIHEADIKYIHDNQIGYLEVSKYSDVWHSCLPFVDIYSLYNLEEIRMSHLKIIHNTMFARVSNIEYIGNWNLLIGNIPRFLEQYEIDIDWNKMYEVMKWFLRESLICDVDDKEQLE
ncbi:hypothetical protein EDC19_0963 [Natranaerovirga hydrolytica]|uniref:Uncharacterized protein n=1 Tax=Natranaerovirga hydrolytica TaxID=680378 RepID=A0A4R1N3B9_9FIRM|nr:ATP-binding protein [Natranaerovirga hydrolytica]TCK98534.1 hypothetical protein EDC19_0963 [Natranaerovirga hydrolytica]